MKPEEIKAEVRDKYGKAALKVVDGGGASCCGGSCSDPVTSNL